MHGVIAAQHRETAMAAVEILRAGGNAFDAAIAALATSFVAEPGMTSPGGGGFLTAHSVNGQCAVFDFFCQTPINKRPTEDIDFYPIEVDFGSAREIFHIGNGSMGTPGNVAGIFAIHEQLSTMPITTLLEPAILLAKQGIVVDEFQGYTMELLDPILRRAKAITHWFYQDNQLLKAGSLMKMPELADCLEVMGLEGRRFFYEGEIAQSVATHCQLEGGHLSLEDWKKYAVKVVNPLTFTHYGYAIHTNPPPSDGGSIIHMLFHFLEQESSGGYGAPSIDQLFHLLHRVQQVRGDEQAFLDYQRQAYPSFTAGTRGNIRGTTHFSIMDEQGNTAALSTTNGQGCGYAVPGAGVFMNNMLGEGALFPHGFHSWECDSRISSMMAPTIVVEQNSGPYAALGTGGAGRIPFAIAQVLMHLLDEKTAVEEAVLSPRAYWHNGVLNLEPGWEDFNPDHGDLRQIINWPHIDMFFGGVHTILREKAQITGMGDPRRAGCVMSS